MKKRPVIIIILIIGIAALCAASFDWLISGQQEKLESQDRAAGKAVAQAIPETVSMLSENFAKAGQDLRAELASDHVYAHRGSMGASMEHSFAQYDKAIRAGARQIEQDIVLSAEGTLYVSHDLTAQRLTGDPRAFSEMTDVQIDQLRTYEGKKTLSLKEVFNHYGRSIDYIVELKNADPAAIKAFEDLVDESGLQDRITVQCFEPEALRILEEVYPDMPKLYLVETQEGLDQGAAYDFADIISAESSLMTEENVKLVHESGKKFSVWTLVGEDQIRRAIDLGVDTYFTDDVETALALEKTYGLEKRYLIEGDRQSQPDKAKLGSKSAGKGSAGVKTKKATVFLASDYQIQEGWEEPRTYLTGILKAAKKAGKRPQRVIYCGDYTNEEGLYDYQLSPEASIREIRRTVRGVYPGIRKKNMLFLQGNHDKRTESITSSGLHEYKRYLVYVLNTQADYPWKQGKASGTLTKVKKSAKKMKKCFRKLAERGESRPVLVISHVPLHYTARTSSRHGTGDNLYASLIFNAVNDAAKKLDIVYFFGHNHSKGWDCYMGGSCVYKGVGDSMLIPAFERSDVTSDRYAKKKLRFTYLNAGYTGYYLNCGLEEVRAETADEYAAADNTLTGTICEITPKKIILTRYSADGKYALGSAGEANPYQGGIDAGLIDPADYNHATESPQKILRKHR